MVNNSAAHQKQRQSLSPENKVQILCNDADAHRKLCESSSPEKKVKILETDADAHKKKQKSLSLDDKDLFVKNHIDTKHNIASLSLLIRKLKYMHKMLLNTKTPRVIFSRTESSSYDN